MAEQLSVLAVDKQVSAAELGRFLPDNNGSRLPVLVSNGSGSGQEFSNEREILYQLFFDMKRDVTELKRLFLEMLQNPSAPSQSASFLEDLKELQATEHRPTVTGGGSNTPGPSPVILQDDIQTHIEVDESLNIQDKEKELIIKALKKHKGKRKDAASDLGISERTLYRKLKEYSIDE
jgi:uncharacterized membrane protein